MGCQCKCASKGECSGEDVRKRGDLRLCHQCRKHWDEGYDFRLDDGHSQVRER